MSDPVSYTAVLPVRESTVLFVSGLLAAERRRRGTRGRRRALGCYRQAVLVLRWFLDGARLAQLATDNAIGCSTAYRYLHEGIDALAAAAPGLRGARCWPPAPPGNSLLKTPSRRCPQSTSALGASARSPPPPSYCSTTSTAALHDQRANGPVTGNGSLRSSNDKAVARVVEGLYALTRSRLASS